MGSSAQVPCPLGQYCDMDNLATPTGNCSAGFFCNGSESTPNPVPCGLGHYCPSGTTSELACPPGTYLSKLPSCLLVAHTYFNLLQHNPDF